MRVLLPITQARQSRSCPQLIRWRGRRPRVNGGHGGPPLLIHYRIETSDKMHAVGIHEQIYGPDIGLRDNNSRRTRHGSPRFWVKVPCAEQFTTTRRSWVEGVMADDRLCGANTSFQCFAIVSMMRSRSAKPGVWAEDGPRGRGERQGRRSPPRPSTPLHHHLEQLEALAS